MRSQPSQGPSGAIQRYHVKPQPATTPTRGSTDFLRVESPGGVGKVVNKPLAGGGGGGVVVVVFVLMLLFLLQSL